MNSIFISYRHDDALGFALTLYKELSRCFKADEVFYDQEDRHHIRYGDDWFDKIRVALGTAKVFLAVIGPGWLNAVDEHDNRRLWQENDVVRWEIEQALKRQENGELKIIPVLVNNASFPKDLSELPPSLVDLTKAQACPLSANPADFDSHFGKLLECLAAVPGIPKPLPSARQSRIFHTIDHILTKYFSDPAGHLPLLYTTLHETGKAAVTASSATAALHGMGGVGKTQLALNYSWDYRDEYAGVWWFRAEDLSRLQQDCQQFCERCGIQVNTGEEHHQAVKRWLQEQPRWLLVYDNAEAQYGERKETLHPFLPGGDHHVLITSRNNCWDGLARPIELDVWDEEQALEFLRKRLEKATDGELRALCRALGGLPLALEQACAYIVKVGVSVDGYCKALADWEKGEGLLDRKDSLASGYSHSVLATLSLAFGRLSEGARDLLRLCGWCAAEPIPESVFLGGERFLPEALKKIVTDELCWREVVAELSGYALAQVVVIDLTPHGANERVTEQALLLHRLTQEAIRRRISEPEIDCRGVICLLLRAYPADGMHPHLWATCKALTPHVRFFDAYYEMEVVPVQAYVWLLARVAIYLHFSSGLYEDSIRLLRRGLEISQKDLGEEHPDTLALMNNLSGMLQMKGDLEGALILQKQDFRASMRNFGLKHHWTLSSMCNLGELLRVKGDLNSARTIQEKVLKIRRREFGEDDLETLIVANNLALVLKDQGCLAEAADLHIMIHEKRFQSLGASHPSTLSSMNNFAEVLRAMDDLSNARKLQEIILESLKQSLGEEHVSTIIAMGNLASTLQKERDFVGARVLQERVLDFFRRQHGIEHQHTSTSAFNLFNNFLESGAHEEAQELFRSDLAWLLGYDPLTLGATHRTIQEGLRKYVEQQAE